MKQLLEQLKIKADIISIEESETILRYYLRLQPGGKVSSLERYVREIALGMKSYNVPIIKTHTEKGLISLEFITKETSNVNFFDVLPHLKPNNEVPIILGKTYSGQNLISNLCRMPHLLVAGTTGSGKSSLLHSIICSTLYSDNVKLILVDPKMVEFAHYSNVNNLLYPIIKDKNAVIQILDELIEEMNKRFKILDRHKKNNIIEYNKVKKRIPYYVLIIDEFSDLSLSLGQAFQNRVCSIAQKSRACGLYSILATQRASTKIINGDIKANYTSRISFKVASAVDSRIILDANGANLLLGNGDGLISSSDYNMLRFKGAFISSFDINSLARDFKKGYLKIIYDWIKNGKKLG